MKRSMAFLAVVALVAAANGCSCGKHESASAGLPFTEGCYVVRDLNVAADTCGIGGDFSRRLHLTRVVSTQGQVLTIPEYSGTPRGQPDGDTAVLEATYRFDHRSDPTPRACVEKSHSTVNLKVTSDTTVAVTVNVSTAVESGTQCGQVANLPCQAQASFTLLSVLTLPDGDPDTLCTKEPGYDPL